MANIMVLGYFGNKSNHLDGQTAKTRNLYKLVCEFDKSVSYYDTAEFRYDKMSIFKMVMKIVSCKILIYLPAHRNLTIIFPFVFCLSVLFRIRVHYFVVGGWLSELLQKLPIHRFLLKQIDGIHVETKKLKLLLENKWGFSNVDLFPNFRYFSNIQKKVNKAIDPDESLKLCFVSRIERSKGLDTMLAISKVWPLMQFPRKIKVDFYGQKVTDDYYDKNLIGIDMFEYRGLILPSEVCKTIESYDALIFPTHYEGEGCPGILVEAMSVGLPIIASEWKYNSEFVENGVNGYLCPVYDADKYCAAIINLFDDDTRISMGLESYKKSLYFSDDNARTLLKRIFA